MKSDKTYSPRILRRKVCHPVRGVEYRVNEWGDPERPLMVLLHGWGDTGSSFQFFVDALAADWFVIAPDWRGFGETRYQAQGYWFPDYIADLDALLDLYSGQHPARLVGHSMGANVAGLYAGIFPERVAAFVNIEGFGLAESDPANAPAYYRRWIEKGRLIAPRSSYTAFAELAQRILKRSPRMSHDKANYVAGLWAEQVGNDAVELRADPAHRLPNAVQYRRAEAKACWQQITAPVLVVKGADSDFYSRALEATGPNEMELFTAAETVVIPGAGHMLHFEQPGALAIAVESFLN